MIKVSTKKLILDNSIKQRFNKLCNFGILNLFTKMVV